MKRLVFIVLLLTINAVSAATFIGKPLIYSDNTATNFQGASYGSAPTVASTNFNFKGVTTGNGFTATNSVIILSATASKPAKFGADQSLTNGLIDLSTDVTGTLALGSLPSGATLDTEWNTVSKIEATTGANIITSDEIDTIAELEALLGGVNVIISTEINTTAKINSLTTDDDFATLLGAQTLASKTLTQPVIADFTSAGHSHQNAAGGGTLNAAAIAAGTMASARLGSGLTDGSTVLFGNQVFAHVTENTMLISDNTTNNATTSAHGFQAKADGNANHVYKGDGTQGTIDAATIGAGTMATARLGSGTANTTTVLRGDQSYAQVVENTILLADNTTNNASASKHGLLPKLSGSASDVLKGDGSFGTVPATITVQELDGTPTVVGVTTLKVTNGKLADNGDGTVNLDLSGGGSGSGDSVTFNGSAAVDPDFTNSTKLFWVLDTSGANFAKAYPTNIANAEIATSAAIDAAKIADGSVTSAQYQRLAGVTSAIQSQIDGKVATTRAVNTGAGTSGGGDLSADRTIIWAPDTFVNNLTFWDSSQASRTLTFGLSGATDPVLTIGNNSFDVSTGVLKQGGTAVALSTTTITVAGTANQIASSVGAQDISANRTVTLSLPSAITLPGTINKWTLTAPTTAFTFTPGADNTVLTGPAATDTLVGRASTDTLTNKRITARITSISSSATPTVNTDNADCVTITALAAAITSMTTNLSGTPNNFDQLEYRILDNGTARAITWGATFVSGPATLPTTTTLSKALHVYLEWDSVQSKWVCMSTGSDA